MIDCCCRLVASAELTFGCLVSCYCYGENPSCKRNDKHSFHQITIKSSNPTDGEALDKQHARQTYICLIATIQSTRPCNPLPALIFPCCSTHESVAFHPDHLPAIRANKTPALAPVISITVNAESISLSNPCRAEARTCCLMKRSLDFDFATRRTYQDGLCIHTTDSRQRVLLMTISTL